MRALWDAYSGESCCFCVSRICSPARKKATLANQENSARLRLRAAKAVLCLRWYQNRYLPLSMQTPTVMRTGKPIQGGPACLIAECQSRERESKECGQHHADTAHQEPNGVKDHVAMPMQGLGIGYYFSVFRIRRLNNPLLPLKNYCAIVIYGFTRYYLWVVFRLV